MDKRDTIVVAACDLLASVGMDRITVARVAKAARVSSALVHYHFATKQRLLAAAAGALADRRAERRLAALSSARGMSSLDDLWRSLDPRDSVERTAPDLTLLARQDRGVAASVRRARQDEQAGIAVALPALLESLGARVPIPPEELAVTVRMFLDGAAAALVAGDAPEDVRASYDAFWLALVALGQAAPAAR